ncbi:transmembrane protein [Anaeramoeba flamelloides]|uniref:Transmembrane protein n=1 Tax=Anaeramoeba flamelloides TaxID=1746091 RepID=A0ABQ8YEY6_9EUKA|nr:transmembrane protein [Anaeramoeba flamelloides]
MKQPKAQQRFTLWGSKEYTIFFLIFFIVCTAMILIGAFGPHVYTDKYKTFKGDLNEELQMDLIEMSRLNRYLLISAQVNNNMTVGIITTLQFTIKFYGTNYLYNQDPWVKLYESKHRRNITCKVNENCTIHSIVNRPFVHYKNYRTLLTIENESEHNFYDTVYLKATYINKNLTLFELALRYIYVMCVIIWLTYLTYSTKGFSFRTFIYEQKLTAFILILLLCFNNPLNPLLILSDSLFLRVLDTFFASLFFISIWCYWLCILDNFRTNKRSFRSFYLPKLSLLLIMFGFFFGTYLFVRYHQLDDPQYEASNDTPGFRIIIYIMIVCFLYYLMWLFFSGVRGNSESKKSLDPTMVKRFRFFFWFSFIVAIFSIVVLIGSYFQKIKNSAAEFMAIFTIYNVYLIMYSYASLPVKDNSSTKIVEKHDHTLHGKELLKDSSSDINEDIELGVNENNQIEIEENSNHGSNNSKKYEKSEKSEKSDKSDN